MSCKRPGSLREREPCWEPRGRGPGTRTSGPVAVDGPVPRVADTHINGAVRAGMMNAAVDWKGHGKVRHACRCRHANGKRLGLCRRRQRIPELDLRNAHPPLVRPVLPRRERRGKWEVYDFNRRDRRAGDARWDVEPVDEIGGQGLARVVRWEREPSGIQRVAVDLEIRREAAEAGQ